MRTLAQLKTSVISYLFPDGLPDNLVAAVDRMFVDALVEIQRYIDCYQVDNVSLFPHCSTHFRCGVTAFDRPQGRISRVEVIETEGWCNPVQYLHVSPEELRSWSRGFAQVVQSPANTNMPKLPLGLRYPEKGTDSPYGRALAGQFAIDRQTLLVSPWIQSGETVVVYWDGIKQDWTDADPVSEGTDFERVVRLFVKREYARNFECAWDVREIEPEYREAFADLAYECREQTRTRVSRIPAAQAEVLLATRTAPTDTNAEETPLIFAVIGDFGADNADSMDVAELVKGWNPEFILTTGDNNYDSGAAETIDANIGKKYRSFIHPYQGNQPLWDGETDATTNRFWPVLGNHDLDTVESAVAGKPYLDYFTLPNNGRYYELRVGELHFLFVNSGINTNGEVVEPDGNTAVSIQAEWLQFKLLQSTARWKIVVFHHPPYTSREGYDPGITAMRWDFKGMGADMVFNGHSHSYERFNINGFPYFVNGAGGKDLVPFDVNPVTGSVVRYAADFGAMRCAAKCREFKVEFINVDGQVIDTFTLSK